MEQKWNKIEKVCIFVHICICFNNSFDWVIFGFVETDNFLTRKNLEVSISYFSFLHATRTMTLVAFILFLTQISNSFQWRPIFKINTGIAYYGGQSDPNTYYIQGEDSFTDLATEYAYTSSIPTSNDGINFRSKLINMWKNHEVTVNKVRMDFYGSENKYVEFNTNNINGSFAWYDWLRTDYIIDSSWTDLTAAVTPYALSQGILTGGIKFH